MNALNTYRCEKCQKEIVTIQIDAGTTPFMLLCRVTKDCKGRMLSQFGRNKDGAIPTFEWYRKRIIDCLNRIEAEHHSKGGLFIRPLQR